MMQNNMNQTATTQTTTATALKQNPFFREMTQTIGDWARKRREYERRREQIIAADGWDSDELKALQEEEEQMTFPITAGAGKAHRAWKSTEGDEVEMNDFLWEREVPDFIDTLRKADITTFVYTNQSTAVMENIHQFVAAGCTLEGPCTITKVTDRWGEDAEETFLGLRFRV